MGTKSSGESQVTFSIGFDFRLSSFISTPTKFDAQVVESLPDAAELTEKISSLRATYASLSDQYQASKSKSSKDTYIPLA